MSAIVVFTYVAKPDAVGRNVALVEKFKAWIQKRQDLFKGFKSYQVFNKFAGGKFGEFVEMAEFETLPDLEKSFAAVMADKEYLSTWWTEMTDIMIPGTLGVELWNSVP